MKKAKNLGSIDTIFVPVAIVIGKLVCFAFNALLGAYYGVGKISDAFLMAHAIPVILYDGVATAFITCYIPIYSELRVESPDRIDEYNSNMTSLSFLVSVLVTAVYLIFHRQINSVYASGFSQDALSLLNHYCAIIVWCIPIIGAYSISRAYLQVKGKKAVSSLVQSINYAVPIAALILFFPRDDSLPWATLAASVCAFGIFFASASRTGFRYRFYLSFKPRYVKMVFVMIVPIFLSTLAAEINTMIDKSFASQFSEGIVTSLTYGSQLSFTIQTVVSTSMVTIIYPLLSDRVAKNDRAGVNQATYHCMEFMCWIAAPLIVGGALLARPLIRMLFGYGNFTEENVTTIAAIFAGYLVGVLPNCIRHAGDRVTLAWKKSNYTLITALVTSGLNILLDFVMSRIWGYMGLVFATGIAMICSSLLSLLLVKKNDHSFSLWKVLAGMIHPAAAVAVMGAAVYVLMRALDSSASVTIGWFWKMMICVASGAAVYGGMILIFYRNRVKELLLFFKQVV